MKALFLAPLLAQGRPAVDWDGIVNSPAVMFLVGGVIAVTAIAVTAIVSVQLRKHAASTQKNRLKWEMLARGFTAEEIVRVIEAGGETATTGSDTGRHTVQGAE